MRLPLLTSLFINLFKFLYIHINFAANIYHIGYLADAVNFQRYHFYSAYILCYLFSYFSIAPRSCMMKQPFPICQLNRKTIIFRLHSIFDIHCSFELFSYPLIKFPHIFIGFFEFK